MAHFEVKNFFRHNMTRFTLVLEKYPIRVITSFSQRFSFCTVMRFFFVDFRPKNCMWLILRFILFVLFQMFDENKLFS